jgi:Fe-S cluster assembly ATP-binding protein
VLAITHYSRLLHELRPDRIHVLVKGHIRASGGPELAAELERTGYAEFSGDESAQDSPSLDLGDPFADPF